MNYRMILLAAASALALGSVAHATDWYQLVRGNLNAAEPDTCIHARHNREAAGDSPAAVHDFIHRAFFKDARIDDLGNDEVDVAVPPGTGGNGDQETYFRFPH
jgi:hypothetical protein